MGWIVGDDERAVVSLATARWRRPKLGFGVVGVLAVVVAQVVSIGPPRAVTVPQAIVSPVGKLVVRIAPKAAGVSVRMRLVRRALADVVLYPVNVRLVGRNLCGVHGKGGPMEGEPRFGPLAVQVHPLAGGLVVRALEERVAIVPVAAAGAGPVADPDVGAEVGPADAGPRDAEGVVVGGEQHPRHLRGPLLGHLHLQHLAGLDRRDAQVDPVLRERAVRVPHADVRRDAAHVQAGAVPRRAPHQHHRRGPARYRGLRVERDVVEVELAALE